MGDSDNQKISFGKTNTTTTLTELFIMLAVERLKGHAYRENIVAELREFGVVIKEDTIKKEVERANELFDLSETGQVSFKPLGASLQLRFLLRVIRALDSRNSMKTPSRAFRCGARTFAKGTWTPSGFTAELKEDDRHER